MVNSSKSRDSRFWRLWRQSGAVEPKLVTQARMRSVHTRILDKIRDLYIQSGGEPIQRPEVFECNTSFRSKTGGLEVSFDGGVPHELYTPSGAYTILGTNYVGDTKEFWELFTQAFDVEILDSKENSDRIRSKDSRAYQLMNSGPYVRITERTSSQTQVA